MTANVRAFVGAWVAEAVSTALRGDYYVLALRPCGEERIIATAVSQKVAEQLYARLVANGPNRYVLGRAS